MKLKFTKERSIESVTRIKILWHGHDCCFESAHAKTPSHLFMIYIPFGCSEKKKNLPPLEIFTIFLHLRYLQKRFPGIKWFPCKTNGSKKKLFFHMKYQMYLEKNWRRWKVYAVVFEKFDSPYNYVIILL